MNILQMKKYYHLIEGEFTYSPKFTYSPLSKVIEKQIKTITDQGIKQVETLKALKPEENREPKSIELLFPKEMRTTEIQNEIYEIQK